MEVDIEVVKVWNEDLQAAFDRACAKVDAMTEEEMDEYIEQAMKDLGFDDI